MRVLVTFGTRPEAIKLAPVIGALRQRNEIDLRVCVTAQHRDMLDQVLRLFGITPDHDLDLMTRNQGLADVTCRIITGMTEVLRAERPDWLVVQGDTTTTFAAAIAAFYEKVKVAHVEAGLRTGDLSSPWPEELNRRLTSVMADLHFPPTEASALALRREHVPADRVLVTGNTVIDALLDVSARIDRDPSIAADLDPHVAGLDPAKRLIVVTGHRRESFGDGFARICTAIARLAARGDVEIVYPVHLNPNVRGPVHERLGGLPGVRLIPPLDYLPFVALMKRAALIITDSGGVQEEAPSLGKPVLVMRDKTERREAVEAGTVRLVGTDDGHIVAEASRLLDDARAYEAMSRTHNPYGDGHASRRIADRLVEEARAAERGVPVVVVAGRSKEPAVEHVSV